MNTRKPFKRQTHQVIYGCQLGSVNSLTLRSVILENILGEWYRWISEKEPPVKWYDISQFHFRNFYFMDLEHCEDRYLLYGDNETFVIMDLESKPEPTIVASSLNSPFDQMIVLDAAKWFPCDYRLFAYAKETKLDIWDANEFTAMESFPINEGIVSYAHSRQSSQNQHRIALVCRKGSLKIVDLRTGNVSQTIGSRVKSTLDVSWSPSSEFTLASCGAKAIYLWDVRSPSYPIMLAGERTTFRNITFYPDGIRLVSLSSAQHNSLKVHNIVSKSTLFTDNVASYQAPAAISFYFDFMCARVESALGIYNNSLTRDLIFSPLKPSDCYAFRPSKLELITLSNTRIIKKYPLFLNDGMRERRCDDGKGVLDSDEFD